MVRITLIFITLFFVSACSNPLGGDSGHSTIDENHDPLNENETPANEPADASNSFIVTTPKHVAADNSTVSTVTVYIRGAADQPLAGKAVTLASSRGGLDTITGITPISDSLGRAEFAVQSSTHGVSTLSANVSADSISITHTDKIFFFPVTPIADLMASYATANNNAQNTPNPTTTWSNLGPDLTAYDLTLNNFLFDISASLSRWGGDGTAVITTANDGQNRLIFDGIDDSATMASSNTAASTSFEGWVRTHSTGRGQVIASNADTSARGLTLRQSWDGQGYLSLYTGHQSYAEAILTDNPIAFWRLGESSGSTVYNSTATTGLEGQLVAGVTLNGTGPLPYDTQGAITVSRPGANNGSISVADHNSLDGSSANSIEAWVNLDTSCNSAICGIVSKRVNSGSHESYILYTDARKVIFRVNGNSGQQLTRTNSLTAGTWYHIVAVFDSSLSNTGSNPSANHRMKIYINGALDITRSSSLTSVSATASGFSIGSLSGNTSSGWGGKIANVAYYDYALSAAQVLAHYNARNLQATQSTNAIVANTWAHVGGVFDFTSGDLSIYLNGTSDTVTKAGAAIANSSSTWTLGASNFSGTIQNNWEGALAEFRVYDQALSAAEIGLCRSLIAADYP